MRVCVAAICRNEEKNMEEFLNHVAKADAISIVDTGSTDNTVRFIERFNHPELHFAYDIDPNGGRNLGESRNLAAAPFKPDDLIVWLDIDERFSDPDWVESLKSLPAVPDTVRINMHNNGSVYFQHKAYLKKRYAWKYRAHEVLVKIDNLPESVVDADFHTTHYPDLEKPRNYLPELAADVTDNPRDERSLFYYARELCYRVLDSCTAKNIDKQAYQEAVSEIARLNKLAYWEDYICLINVELSCAAYMVGDRHTAISAGNMAIAARPDRSESYGTFADIMFRYGDYVYALALALQGINAKNQTPLLFDSSQSNLDLCLNIAYQCCESLGMVDKAIHYYAQLCSVRGLDVNESLKSSGLLEKLQKSQ
ncbi:putative glycosyl transferase [Dickeya phage vB_DsoM_JA33]|uniref:Putative glycosyl transferase n=3 Tax=Salmondvirus JA11 TaxID=2734141 RepID=A0A384ZWB7_9CAUD|nr:beta-1,4-glycosyltransferase [Dickeya phage vB_DsoM_JA11]AXG66538.1 putative glycosyl transferase [Dickeya phage vB_DsoM_JA13]AXG67508.1 putative glycosyl transferase [Dickeya phage vB_DsoM_JA33]AYD79939.1 putative glycosyl transferase [Dickeya phage vB_DsoM_JA11]